MYKLDPYSLEIHRMRENKLPTLRLSKVIVRHTYIHTDTTEIMYHAASRVVNKTTNHAIVELGISYRLFVANAQPYYGISDLIADTGYRCS